MKYVLIAFGVGVLSAATLFYFNDSLPHWLHTSNYGGKHPAGYADTVDEVHVHSDFKVVIAGQHLDFSADTYQTTSQQARHKHIHLHDNVGHVIHRHDSGVYLTDFFASLGFALTNECITTDTGQSFCNNQTDRVQLFVNRELTDSITDYENQEADQILLFYGPPDDPAIDTLLNQITDEACIYSGTCPERGVAPPESCGLTCEL